MAYPWSVKTPGAKVRLIAYEFMFVMGAAGNSHFSEQLKRVLTEETATPAYAGLEPTQAFGKAARHLSMRHPEAFYRPTGTI